MEDTNPLSTENARKLFSGTCDFMLGVASLDQLPEADKPEIAFAGRSNVGKSSLLNALTGRKALARTSNTPGRTQQLNFFNLGDQCFLVDMPGYGYAKVSKAMRKEWDKLIFTYLRGRANLRSVFILIDSRHGIKENDRELMKMLDEAAVSFRIIMTKADKGKNRAEMEKDTREILKKHPAAYPEIIFTSAEKGEGLEELRTQIYQVIA